MASLIRRANGTRGVQINRSPRERPVVWLGAVSDRAGKAILAHIESLEVTRTHGAPIEPATRAWLTSIGDDLHERLCAAGLVNERPRITVAQLMSRYIDNRRPHVKARTMLRLEQAKTSLLEAWPDPVRISDFTAEHAMELRDWMLAHGYAEATTRKRCADVSAAFAWAMHPAREWVERNPFVDVPTAHVAPRDRHRFIDCPTATAILDSLADPQWRLLFALARWGGLRVGSEPRALTWADVDFERSRLTINDIKRSSRGEHRTRTIPMFPELQGPLQAVYDAAPEGESMVLPMMRGATNTGLSKRMARHVKSAGVEPWPKLWQNLRASRETELADRFPEHVVCAWIGNTPRVARANYLQVVENHFALALQNAQQSSAESRGTDRKIGGRICFAAYEKAYSSNQLARVGLSIECLSVGACWAFGRCFYGCAAKCAAEPARPRARSARLDRSISSPII